MDVLERPMVTQEQVDDINRKLDVILEEIELQRRHRREMEDLKDDLMRVGKDVYATAVEELEEEHDHLQTGDVLHLVKRLLRNVRTMNQMLAQLESARDFVNDFGPVSREMFRDVMMKLDEYDRKGYFEFLGELQTVADKIVTSFSKEDVKNLGDNIVTILNTVKNLTQPDMLSTVNNAMSVYRNLDVEVEEKISMVDLLKELNSPQTKRSMVYALRLLQNLSQQQSPTAQKPHN